MKRLHTLTAAFLAIAMTCASTDLSAQTRSTNTTQTSRSTSSQTSRSSSQTNSRQPASSSPSRAASNSSRSSESSVSRSSTSRQSDYSTSRSNSGSSQTVTRSDNDKRSVRNSTTGRSSVTTFPSRSSSSSRTVNSTPSRRSNDGGISRSTNSGISRSGSSSSSRNTGMSRSSGSARQLPSREGAVSEQSANTSTPLTGRQVLSSNPNVRFTDGTTGAAGSSSNSPQSPVQRPKISDNNGYDRYDYDTYGHRIHPRHRDPFRYDHFHCDPFYHRGYHYFGYRVHILPPRYTIIHRWGRTYYFYNGVYYTNYGGDYYVSRPPFGVVFTVKHPDYAPVGFNFYGNRRTLAMDASIAIAEGLNLTQTFAYPELDYYYEDGIFFRRSYYGNGFEVVIPPAGALVSQIPDDFDMFTWYGHELYQVDNTVYRPVVVNGIPMLEVVGQVY